MSTAGKPAAGKTKSLKRWKITPNHRLVKVDPDLLMVVHVKHGVQHFLIERTSTSENVGWKVVSVRSPPDDDDTTDGPYESTAEADDIDEEEEDDDDYDDDDDDDAADGH